MVILGVDPRLGEAAMSVEVLRVGKKSAEVRFDRWGWSKAQTVTVSSIRGFSLDGIRDALGILYHNRGHGRATFTLDCVKGRCPRLIEATFNIVRPNGGQGNDEA